MLTAEVWKMTGGFVRLNRAWARPSSCMLMYCRIPSSWLAEGSW